MAKKEVLQKIKLQVPGGKATPAPPLGPTLGQAGVNIGEFTNKFNEETKERMGETIPTILTVYEDRSFDIEYKVMPMSKLILREIGKESGSGKNLTSKAGSLNNDQVKKIAEEKMPDLNAFNVEAAMEIVKGTAYSMGVEIK